jgi:glycosyltransferase involved in cell wall biosynthesis
VKIVTVSDAWRPQVNGVVRTIEATNAELERAGHRTVVIGPDQFLTLPCPGYDGIRLALFPHARLSRRLQQELHDAGDDDAVALHIATEGPLGHAARRWCLRRDIPFTTAYHTRFPQYLEAFFGVPPRWTYAVLRRFHGKASVVMAPTATVEAELRQQSIGKVARWTRGVDTTKFRPLPPRQPLPGMRAPVFLYVGRVSIEKNVEAFLALDLPGSKLVAGVGPALRRLKQRYPEVHFLGVLEPDALAQLYSSADVFVFPSRTDTFGLVMLEALACGTPVAAYPVQGPLDVLGDAPVGALDEDLQRAALAALRINRTRCRAFAMEHAWEVATRQFVALQRPLRPLALSRAVGPSIV